MMELWDLIVFQSLFGKYAKEGAIEKDMNGIMKMNKKTQEVHKNITKKE